MKVLVLDKQDTKIILEWNQDPGIYTLTEYGSKKRANSTFCPAFSQEQAVEIATAILNREGGKGRCGLCGSTNITDECNRCGCLLCRPCFEWVADE